MQSSISQTINMVLYGTILKSCLTTPIYIWHPTTSGLRTLTPRKSPRAIANHSGNTSAAILAQVRKHLGPDNEE